MARSYSAMCLSSSAMCVAHHALERRIVGGRERKVVAHAMRILLAVEIEVEHQAVQHGIGDDVAMQARA